MAKERVLIIVESPKKAKTLGAFLKDADKKYDILASYGHIRDLIPKNGAVDIENNYEMHYEVVATQQKHVDKILKSAEKADSILLAPDPDREGEAIAWHIQTLLLASDPELAPKIARIVFYQVTKDAVIEAINQPRQIESSLVNAQQARRALDYLVGFNISPLLWKKIRPGLSAGRVQSPALRMIVDRENEISAFIPKEYWDFDANIGDEDTQFKAKLTHYQGEKLKQFTINNEQDATKLETSIQNMIPQELEITSITKKQRKKNPQAPFTTSTLQQDAASKLGFGTTKTMRVAQQLYEGINIHGEQIGLITYMRTDSVNLASSAITDIRDFVKKQFGNDYIPKVPNGYKTKSKNAQEAHEAIRPTHIDYAPDKIKSSLDADQLKLYQLIWKRSVASQMSCAVYDQVQVILDGQDDLCQFKASGSTLHFPGFLSVYQVDDEKDNKLPELKENQILKIIVFSKHQHFTEPPPRFNEASLVKTLEEYGIGRPSTYASIISTLVKREYVILESRRFFATDVGRYVNRFLTSHFTTYVDYEFTASLEESLDEVSRNEREWLPVLDGFWRPLNVNIEHVSENVSRQEATEVPTEENCPDCEKPLVRKLSRAGVFIACTGYPDCKYTRSENGDDAEKEELDKTCPECSSPLTYKHGRYGKFIGCSNYPDCRYIEKAPVKTIDVSCPKCETGLFVEKKSRRGSLFFACNQYPKCKYAISNEPVAAQCSECQWPIGMKKVTKKQGEQIQCPECKHTHDSH
ncbi:type I DNA topoisomerase [Gammaproteobacteria bacterium]|nr:type I DNA topoisomerase [Gammaproteobacteria bacterium]